jgi:intracellular multiplication protein IcmO
MTMHAQYTPIPRQFVALAIGNADTVCGALVSQLDEQANNDGNAVFRARAVVLIASISPALVWLRDHKDVPLTIGFIRSSLDLTSIWSLAMMKKFKLRDDHTGEEADIVVPDIPEKVIAPLKSYIGELPGYDPRLPLVKQKSEEPGKQHGYALYCLTPIFAQMNGVR